MNGFIDGNPAVGGDVSVAARPKQATLCRRTILFFTVGNLIKAVPWLLLVKPVGHL